MNSKDSYSEIEGIQKHLKSVDRDQLYRELQRLVESNLWRSPLIYGGLCARQAGSADISAFFARKTLEAIEEVCGQGIERGNETLVRGQAASEALRSARKQLDELLVAMTFLVLAFDNKELRAAIRAAKQGMAREIKRIRERFVDTVPLNDYLTILGRQFRGKRVETTQPLGIFFDGLIREAGLDKGPSFEQRAARLKECIERLIGEAGRRIEKPDRIFSCADSLDSISRYAESLFDVEGEKFFNKYKWAYPRGQSFDNLDAFWAACMIGLFAFGQALDRAIALTQASVQAEVKAASTDEGQESSVDRVERASQKRRTQPKKPTCRDDIGTNLRLYFPLSWEFEPF